MSHGAELCLVDQTITMTSRKTLASASLVLTFAVAASGCSGEREAARKRISPEYDKNGRLQLLKYDSKGTGKVDTWSYMDGARVVRIEIDSDDNGRIDRWSTLRSRPEAGEGRRVQAERRQDRSR